MSSSHKYKDFLQEIGTFGQKTGSDVYSSDGYEQQHFLLV